MANRKKEVIRSAIAVLLSKMASKTGALRWSSVPAIEPKY